MLVRETGLGTVESIKLHEEFDNMMANWKKMGVEAEYTKLGNGEKFTVLIEGTSIVHTLVYDKYTASLYID